jgi:8-oxo-dGTP pyrophosphatase MutT (NUDIX family)
MAQAPRPAATLVLLREGDGDVPFEIFFVRRHHRAAFMANAYVFPGGRVDAADSAPTTVARLDGLDLEALAARSHGLTTADEAAAHAVCAIRETFEEAGVLLARRAAALVQTASGPDRARFADHREALNTGRLAFGELLEAEELRLAGDQLVYFAHWITPKAEQRRYDTRFFVAFAPPAQLWRHDERETTDSRWLSPQAALAAYEGEGAFQLAPPTWAILRDLAALPDRQAVLAWAAAADVAPIEPHLTAAPGGSLTLALPGDPLHPTTPDATTPNRIVLREGRWAKG